MHTHPVLWRLHATHHSSLHLYWLSASRFHPFDTAVSFSVSLISLVMLGAGEEITFQKLKLFYLECIDLYPELLHTDLEMIEIRHDLAVLYSRQGNLQKFHTLCVEVAQDFKSVLGETSILKINIYTLRISPIEYSSMYLPSTTREALFTPSISKPNF